MFDALDGCDPAGDAARLDLMRLNHAATASLGVERLHLVLDWALTHPGTGSVEVLDHDDHPGGDGTPAVAAFTAESLAHAYALTPAAAASELADTLDLWFRFPRLWDQVEALLVPVWKARRVARMTRSLSEPAARWVDRQLLGHPASLGTAALDRLIATARARVEPQAQLDAEEAARLTWDVVLTHPRDWVGTSTLTALGDTAELSALKARVDDEACRLPVDDALATAGQQRVHALTTLVRHGHDQLTLDLSGPNPGGDTGTGAGAGAGAGTGAGAGSGPRSVPNVRLFLHADLADLLEGSDGGAPGAIGTVENLGPLTLDRIKEWVGHSRVTIVPVLDLAAAPWSPRHDPPPRMASQVVLNQPRCAFPGCARPARACDLDHCDPWRSGTRLTRPSNLAPLCRRHHRAKTAGVWTYACLDEGYLWTGPHHEQALVTRDGTLWIPPPDQPPHAPPDEPPCDPI